MLEGPIPSSFAEDVKAAIAKAKVSDSEVSVAAINGPKMTVISGRKDAVQKADRHLPYERTNKSRTD